MVDFSDDADEVWPDRDGWLALEFLCWAVRDLRRTGRKVMMHLDASAPHLNGPGRCLTFIIEGERFGEGGYAPEDFISDLRNTYFKIFEAADEN